MLPTSGPTMQNFSRPLGNTSSLRVLMFSCSLWIGESATGFQELPVATLIEAVKTGETLNQEEALYELEKIGPKAKDAVELICQLLSSDSFSIRKLAVDALAAIGTPSIASVQRLLNSDSAASRAAAIQCLSRLNAISFAELKRLAVDKSDGVRAAVAIGLTDCKHPESDSLLIQLLDDSESAVCVQVCLALQQRKTSANQVVPALKRSLEATANEIEVEDVVATLTAYGTDSQRTIPKILEVFGQEKDASYLINHDVETAIKHIGPPNAADAKKLASLLSPTNLEPTSRVLESLSTLGIEGKVAASEIETLIDQLLKRHAEFIIQNPVDDDWDTNEDIAHDITWVIQEAAIAYWDLTNDVDGFLRIVRKISDGLNCGIPVGIGGIWSDFVPPDLSKISELIHSKDLRVVEWGLNAIQHVGIHATQFVNRVIDLHLDTNFKLKEETRSALAAMGPSVAEKTFPVLLKDFRDKKISLRDLARLSDQVGFCPRQCKQELLDEIKDRAQLIPTKIAKLLCKSCRNNMAEVNAIVELFLRAIENSELDSYQVVAAFRLLPSSPKSVQDFSLKCLDDVNARVKIEAADALGDLGPIAKRALPKLKMLLDSTQDQVSLHAAKAIFQITGDADTFRKFLDKELSMPNRLSDCLDAISDLEKSGQPFQDIVFENIEHHRKRRPATLCKILANIKSDETIKMLKQFAASKDWEMKSAAMSVLKELAKSGNHGNEK